MPNSSASPSVVMAAPGSPERAHAEAANARSVVGVPIRHGTAGEISKDRGPNGEEYIRAGASPDTFSPLSRDPHDRAEAIRQAENARDNVPFVPRLRTYPADGIPTDMRTIFAAANGDTLHPRDLQTLIDVQARLDDFADRIAAHPVSAPKTSQIALAGTYLSNPDNADAYAALLTIPSPEDLIAERHAFIGATLIQARAKYRRAAMAASVLPALRRIMAALADARRNLMGQQGNIQTRNALGYDPEVARRTAETAYRQIDNALPSFEQEYGELTPREALRGIIEF